ncbi:type IX secretion system plug protein [Aureisphaera sp.]
MLRRAFFFFGLLGMALQMQAQIIEKIEPEYIRTIQFKGNSQFSQLPIIRLGENLQLSFDDINGTEEDYYYVITHHDFDWTESDLSKGEYMDGFDDVRIETYENSLNSLQLYSHYTLTIPNRETRRIKKSGNYLLSIYDYDGELVFTRKFMVMEQEVKVAVEVKRSRDIQFIETKQSVQFTIDSPERILINPKKNVKTLVLQNSNLKTAITDLVPQYTIGSELIYRYDQESAFWAGNEFLNFDSKEVRGANNTIRRIELNDLFDHYLYTQLSRADRPYTFFPDINGNFVVRTFGIDSDRNPNIEAEYIRMHFNLQYYEDIGNKEIHMYGNFNNWAIDESTYMKYNPATDSFQNTRLFKQGFYNYRFVLVDRDGSIDQGVIGGNFWQTENNYTVIVYYRGPGERFDRVIGYGRASSTNINNN